MDRHHARPFPGTRNPYYWEYNGEPLLLLGASSEDNLFQIDDLLPELDRLVENGGNYVRCTLSSRDPGDRWPFARSGPNGLYDLDQPDPEYWHRLHRFLRETYQRNIFVQMEIWDRFDYNGDPWRRNPFNPENCLNYDSRSSRLHARYEHHPAERANAFFRTVPSLDNNQVLLKYQHAFVNQVLETSLQWPHIFLCVSNETNEAEVWSAYWADYLRRMSRKSPLGSPPITEMWDAHHLGDRMHRRTWKRSDRYAYVEASQANHQRGPEHYHQLLWLRDTLNYDILRRPMNCVKVYGADDGPHGSTQDGIERFWRALFAGCAAVRFHRPPAGLGLSPLAAASLRGARGLHHRLPLWQTWPQGDFLPDPDPALVETYGLLNPEGRTAVLILHGRQIPLKQRRICGPIEWLHIPSGVWSFSSQIPDSPLLLPVPEGQRPFVALFPTETA